MYRIFLPIFIAMTLAGCQMDDQNNNNNGTPEAATDQEMQNKIKQLELDNAMKDSVINEALSFFNEIQENLAAIGAKKEGIHILSTDPELSDEDKQWILEEIKHINFLREDNARNVTRLKKELDKNSVKIEQLEVMIETLLKDIQWKDEQITLLQTELDQLDKDYTRLFDAYQHAALSLDMLTEEMNTVYYAYGTEEELVENKVLEKKNGFLGIGKKTSLKDQFNENYFTAIDATKVTSITVDGSSIRFVSAHQPSSYELVPSGSRTIIKIKDRSEFWKVTKYLIVISD